MSRFASRVDPSRRREDHELELRREVVARDDQEVALDAVQVAPTRALLPVVTGVVEPVHRSREGLVERLEGAGLLHLVRVRLAAREELELRDRLLAEREEETLAVDERAREVQVLRASPEVEGRRDRDGTSADRSRACVSEVAATTTGGP